MSFQRFLLFQLVLVAILATQLPLTFGQDNEAKRQRIIREIEEIRKQLGGGVGAVLNEMPEVDDELAKRRTRESQRMFRDGVSEQLQPRRVAPTQPWAPIQSRQNPKANDSVLPQVLSDRRPRPARQVTRLQPINANRPSYLKMLPLLQAARLLDREADSMEDRQQFDRAKELRTLSAELRQVFDDKR